MPIIVIRHLTPHATVRKFLLLTLQFPARNVRFQSPSKVRHAHARIHNRQDDQDDGDDGEGCEGTADGIVIGAAEGLVHADEFEEEVGEAGKVEDLSYDKLVWVKPCRGRRRRGRNEVDGTAYDDG